MRQPRKLRRALFPLIWLPALTLTLYYGSRTTKIERQKQAARKALKILGRNFLQPYLVLYLVLVVVFLVSLFVPIAVNFYLWFFIATGIATVIGIASATFVSVYILPSEILAPEDMYFTEPSEGTAMFVVRGLRIEDVLAEWKGHHLDDHFNVCDGDPTRRSWWNRKFGIEYIGFWPWKNILWYKFRWTGLTERNDIQPKEEWLNYILLKGDVYLMELVNVEDKNQLHLTIRILFIWQVINPLRAKISVQNWLEAVLHRSKEPIIQYTKTIAYEDFFVTSQGQKVAGEAMKDGLGQAKLTGPTGEFETVYGVRLVSLSVFQVEPPEEYRATTLLKFTAEREKEAALIRADAEVQRIEKVWGKIRDFGRVGEIQSILEALKEKIGPEAKIGAIYTMLPALTGQLSDVFAKPISPEAKLNELLEAIKQLKQSVDKVTRERKVRPSQKATTPKPK